MSESVFEKISRLDLDLRDAVVLVQAEIEYHVNLLMLKKFGTDSFESQRMNYKLMSLNDVGVIDDTLRQDLIQIARIRHLFAHRREAGRDEFSKLLSGINRKGACGSDLRGLFLSHARPSYDLIRQRQEGMS